MKKITLLLLVVLMCMASLPISAYDIAVPNADGVMIYYNRLDFDGDEYYDSELEVTYCEENSPMTQYFGKVSIPEEVTYEGETLKVTAIGNHAFYGCPMLTAVFIPSSVNRIGEDAFYDCHGLMNLYCYAETVPYTESRIIAPLEHSFAALHVPATSLPLYKNDENWQGFVRVVALTTISLPTPQRKIVEQNNSWAYVYHHFEDDESANNGYHETQWMVYYTFDGDTIINGKQYMKLYWYDEKDRSKHYCNAYREDEQGRVYIDYQGGEHKIIDFSMDYEEMYRPYRDSQPDTIIIENIKNSYGQLFRRYRYMQINSDGSLCEVGTRAVEGIGFMDHGLHYLFTQRPTCVCDYEEFACAFGPDYMFSNSDFDRPKEIELSNEEQQWVKGNNDFAFNLFRKARGENNSILSPLSITYALGMLNNGAAGQTQQEINNVLGFGEAGADAINNYCRKLLTETNDIDKWGAKTEMANTIFVNSGLGYELQQGFIDKANQYYDATPTALNFYDDGALDIINQWSNDKTHGMIPEILNNNTFNPNSVSYLLNALYFKGIWTNPFKESDTKDESFNGGASVPMMQQDVDLDYTENDLYQAVRLPYGNEGFRMTIFLPREGKTIDDVLATMNGNNWLQSEKWVANVDLKLPRFKTDYTLPLEDIMSALGMPTAFDPRAAEFPYFGNSDVGVYIGTMFQKASIEVNEKGTEASAVTVIGIDYTGLPEYATFHANRPFFYIISEQSTGCIFFMGQYVDAGPASAISGLSKSNTKENTAIYDLQGRQVANGDGQLPKGIYLYNGHKVVVK